MEPHESSALLDGVAHLVTTILNLHTCFKLELEAIKKYVTNLVSKITSYMIPSLPYHCGGS